MKLVNVESSRVEGDKVLERIVLFIIPLFLSLIFIQTLREFIAYIYFINLSAMSIDPSIFASVLLLFSFLLIPFSKKKTHLLYLVSSVSCIVFRLLMFPFHTFLALYILMAGLSLASFVVFLPVLLVYMDKLHYSVFEVTSAVAIGFSIDVVSRIWGRSFDLSTQLIGYVLLLVVSITIIVHLILAWHKDWIQFPDYLVKDSPHQNSKLLFLGVGVGASIFLFYGFLAYPTVLSRWTGHSYLLMAIFTLVGFSTAPTLLLTIKEEQNIPNYFHISLIANTLLIIWTVDFVVFHSIFLIFTSGLAVIALFLDLSLLFRFSINKFDLEQNAIFFGIGFTCLLLLIIFFVFSVTYGQISKIFKGTQGFLIFLASFLTCISSILVSSRLKEVVK